MKEIKKYNQTDFVLTSSSHEHDKENRVEELEAHDEHILMSHCRDEEHTGHCQGTFLGEKL